MLVFYLKKPSRFQPVLLSVQLGLGSLFVGCEFLTSWFLALIIKTLITSVMVLLRL